MNGYRKNNRLGSSPNLASNSNRKTPLPSQSKSSRITSEICVQFALLCLVPFLQHSTGWKSMWNLISRVCWKLLIIRIKLFMNLWVAKYTDTKHAYCIISAAWITIITRVHRLSTYKLCLATSFGRPHIFFIRMAFLDKNFCGLKVWLICHEFVISDI